MGTENWFGIPTKRLFNFRTKDIKKIVNSDWWKNMHLEIAIKYCDYPNSPNHGCLKVPELKCADCEVYKIGLYKRPQEG
jgi:hypothetical protein